MKYLKLVSALLFVILLLAACGPAHVPSAEIARISAAVINPVPSASQPDILEHDPSDEYFYPDLSGCSILPGSLPELDQTDRNKFNPDRVFSYLIETPWFSDFHYWYDIDKAEQINGRLNLYVTLNLWSEDVDMEYSYLIENYSLSAEDIHSLSVFSECIIENDIMYANQDALEDRKCYESYEDWQENGDGVFPNSISLGEVPLTEPMPVADDAEIYLLYLDSNEYTKLTTQQLAECLLADGAFKNKDVYLSNIYFKYSKGEITAIYQDSGDI